ncbi:MAG: Bifunctional purine biosynthesis protein PurH [Microgenomates group bacterium GW2011_GWA2_37_6]|nr:MAG: Bifunctional purine biosynthesis protein PurH [Microgenomates group bacterium GW2011_GWA2_37_6]
MAGKRKPSKKYALISVFDKTGVVDFARTLESLGYRIISTGGTANALTDAGLIVTPIQDVTGNPESFDGRMKTISFQIEGGILYDRKNPKHIKEARALLIKPIDIVAANLYPFEQTVSNPKVKLEEAIENIDVGGPTMIRAAAKNHKNVLVITDPKDYVLISDVLSKKKTDDKLRLRLAAKAFRHLSFYDSQVASFLGKDEKEFPEELAVPGIKTIDLRYGENPHQKASVYFEPNTNSPLAKLTKITGRDLSATNFTDIFAGLESIRVFKEPSAVVIKHNSPSGIALGKLQSEALKLAKVEMMQAVPYIKKEAVDFIKSVRKSTGIYIFGKIPNKRSNKKHLRFFDGGFIMQDWDEVDEKNFKNWKIVTKKKPTLKQLSQMKIAWKFIGRIKSNTIIVVDKNLPMTRGIGSGQTSRVRSAKIALEQAGKFARGGILASDSFFPFDDSVRLASKFGISTIIQQGGSVNDKASIDAANEFGIPMVMTGERKFWH